MKKLQNTEPCSLGHEIALRMTRTVADALCSHMRADPHHEQMAFALGHHASTADGTVIAAKEVFLPDQEDLEEQSAAGVSPTQAFLLTPAFSLNHCE